MNYTTQLFEQILNERDIKSILFDEKYSVADAKKIIQKKLNLSHLNIDYNGKTIYTTDLQGNSNVYKKAEDGIFYEYDGDVLKGLTSNVAPQELQDYVNYRKQAEEHKSKINLASRKEKIKQTAKASKNVKAELLEEYGCEKFSDMWEDHINEEPVDRDGVSGSYEDEVYGTFKIFFRNTHIGYARLYGNYSFDYEARETYHSRATYWDPEESAGNWSCSYTDDNAEFSFWEREATEEDLEDENGPMDLNAFVELQHPAIRDLVRNYVVRAMEDALGFVEDDEGDWG